MKTRIEKLEAALAKLRSKIPERAHDMALHAQKHPLPYAITGLGLAVVLGQAVRIALRKPEPPPSVRERVVRAAKIAGRRATEFAESPAGIVATGFLTGLLLPPTSTQREGLDDTARRVIDDVKEAGHDVIEEGNAAVKEMLAAADSAVREATEETGDMVRAKLDRADEVVREAANEVDQAVSKASRKNDDANREAADEASSAIKETVNQTA